MIIDARSLPADEILESHICIVGAGPAGLTIAREFANQDFTVCLVESGGFEFDKETQALSEGTVVGDPYPVVHETRRRQLGGTAHCWEGQSGYQKYGWRCLPLDPIDFEQRDWVPNSGWPFSRSDLDPFYERAQTVCQIGPYSYDADYWQGKNARPLSFKTDRVTTGISQYGLRDPFTTEYPNSLRQTPNITTLIHANVLNIEVNESGQKVTRLQISTLQGKQCWIKASHFILAAGGMENARLLLVSNRQYPAGVGNQHDVVGRYFMDRPILSCGIIPYKSTIFNQTDLYDIFPTKQGPVMAHIKLSEATMRQEGLMNNGAQLFPRPLPHQREATLALRELIASLRHRKLPKDMAKHLAIISRGSDYVVSASFWAAIRNIPGFHRGDWSYLPYEKSRFSRLEVFYQLEQAPDRNNRIVLSKERDSLNLPKTEIHWRLNEIDIKNAIRIQEIWAEELDQAGIGELRFTRDWTKQVFEKTAMHHHIGSTRMHNSPKKGVVDSNSKVHNISNLFIAGCSVFPTSGYSNPTLTMIALSLRLADHVKQLAC
ncbi:GMC family oxidoreductase [Nodosilinea sp. LEGE 07088]|uniref:GMC oxidoreductase n=1 Tax=Nodosilinea sp. LEGE 07088 TaxID=2777968 RepID=UPI001880B24B|nr:GMC family oxidoreductase [Nodosilinea sp. LEGE 07088]MBE9135872.1 GMC family oxidoreductase [Nodosilinea sp. LEGE 07088]